MITQEELNAMNRASAEREAREAQQRYEMYGGVYPDREPRPPRRPSYFPEETPADHLASIERENVESSRINYHE